LNAYTTTHPTKAGRLINNEEKYRTKPDTDHWSKHEQKASSKICTKNNIPTPSPTHHHNDGKQEPSTRTSWH
jgi:hypothetical protein